MTASLNNTLPTMFKRTPQETLRRVAKVARFNGWTVVVISGICTLASLVSFDVLGLVVGGIVVAAGVIELRGLRHLRQRTDADRAVTLLVRAQLLILALICIYCLIQLLTLNVQSSVAEVTQALMQAGMSPADLEASGLDSKNLAHLLRLACLILYTVTPVLSLFYQGGLALYYHRRRSALREALGSPPIPVVPCLPTVGEDVMDN